jgi:hypothetical protein
MNFFKLLLETSKLIIMTEKERELTQDMLDLIDRIKTKTDFLDTDDRIPVLQLEVILSKIEQLHQKAIGLKYLHQHADDIRSTLQARSEETNEVIVEDTNEASIPIEEPVVNQKEIEIEKIDNDISSLGVSNFNATNEDIGEKLQQQPISDIKSAIGINDKFLYINELFGGSAEEFETIVNLLNQFTSMDEAQQSLEKYGWVQDNETTQSFVSLVSRRYL